MRFTCRRCDARQSADAAEHERRFGRNYLERAPEELRAARVPTTEVHFRYWTWSERRLGRPPRQIESVELWGRGWLVGSFEWRVRRPTRSALDAPSNETRPAATFLVNQRAPLPEVYRRFDLTSTAPGPGPHTPPSGRVVRVEGTGRLFVVPGEASLEARSIEPLCRRIHEMIAEAGAR